MAQIHILKTNIFDEDFPGLKRMLRTLGYAQYTAIVSWHLGVIDTNMEFHFFFFLAHSRKESAVTEKI